MNKKLVKISSVIMVASAMMLGYFITHPEIDTCAPPYDPETGFTGMETECTVREHPNHIGITSSLAGLVGSGALVLYALVGRNAKNKKQNPHTQGQ